MLDRKHVFKESQMEKKLERCKTSGALQMNFYRLWWKSQRRSMRDKMNRKL